MQNVSVTKKPGCRVPLVRLNSNSRVAFDHQIVIVIIKIVFGGFSFSLEMHVEPILEGSAVQIPSTGKDILHYESK